MMPPTVKRKMKPTAHRRGASKRGWAPCSVAIQLNTLTPVGMAMIIVAAEK